MDGSQGRLVAHTEVEQFLRRFGYSTDYVHDLLRDLPDPVEYDRARKVLSEHGITTRGLMDEMGASP
jgi:hypothetical protein